MLLADICPAEPIAPVVSHILWFSMLRPLSFVDVVAEFVK
jgi:hypothetical protein